MSTVQEGVENESVKDRLRKRSHDLGQERHEKISKSLKAESPENSVTVNVDSSKGEVYAVANRDFHRGDRVQECVAASIAIDACHRRSRCGFCASVVKFYGEQDDRMSQICEQCGIVSVCSRCKNKGALLWHDQSGECFALRSLVLSMSRVFGSLTKGAECKDLHSFAEQVDSLYILAVRLMFRRWYDSWVDRYNCTAAIKRTGRSGKLKDPPQHVHCPKKARKENTDVCTSNAVDSVEQSKKLYESPLPPVDWDAFDTLYVTDLSDEQSAMLENLSELMRSEFNRHLFGTMPNDSGSWVTKSSFQDVIGKCVGCGHAITDLTLPLGDQVLGRSLFWSHSFYNHSCVPNAVLSCVIRGSANSKDEDERSICSETVKQQENCSKEKHLCALSARVHSMKNIRAGIAITLSYIPTSGLDRAERQRRLCQGYQFRCTCRACKDTAGKEASSWERALHVPNGGDVDALREIQFSCNQTLLKIQRNGNGIEQEDELNSCIGMIKMMSNGIRNQGIPSSHEVCIEKHRLMAAALSLSGKADQALEFHRYFFEVVKVVEDLFDPIALASQKIAFAGDLVTERKFNEAHCAAVEALDLSRAALGSDHPFTVSAKKNAETMHDIMLESA